MANQASFRGVLTRVRVSLPGQVGLPARAGRTARIWPVALFSVFGVGLLLALPEQVQAQSIVVAKLIDRTPSTGGREVFFKASSSSEAAARVMAMSACRAELRAAASGSIVRNQSACEISTLADFQAASGEADRSKRLAVNTP